MEILLLIGWENRRLIESMTEMLSALPIAIYLLPDENVGPYLDRRAIDVGTTWAYEVQRAPLTRTEQFVKRCFDVIGATSALLLLSPLMLLTRSLDQAGLAWTDLVFPDSQRVQWPSDPDREVQDHACA